MYTNSHILFSFYRQVEGEEDEFCISNDWCERLIRATEVRFCQWTKDGFTKWLWGKLFSENSIINNSILHDFQLQNKSADWTNLKWEIVILIVFAVVRGIIGDQISMIVEI